MEAMMQKCKLRLYGFAALLATGCLLSGVTQSYAQAQKPNILLIMGDDIGYWNISAYNRGQMGYRTPNIDRIANEGAIFTDYYGQQSCTAGRAAFITGQSPMRTGLLKVGLPGAKEGLSDKDPTMAELLKPQGYVTAQFGKNHLGDRNEFLPTVHGFDVFFGNLYHLNAEDEPEHPDYPKNPAFRAQFGPRGVLKCVATTADTPSDDPRFGPWGKQKCEDTGPLTKKRMETIDEEFLKATTDFIDQANRDKKPFLVWFNPTRMHIWTRLKPESQGKTGLGVYPDGMVEHDGQVGQLLKKLDDLGIANNTIVVYTTDNGAETFSWPDGGTTPYRSEKNTNWEGGYRVPALIRWPGVVQPRAEINDIFSAEDWVTTIVAAAGEPNIKEKLLQGYDAAGKTFKVHLDGYDQRDLLSAKGPDKRREFFYWTDDGDLAGLRYDQYKAVFMEQPAHGLEVWMQPFLPLRTPKLFNLRSDPFERAQYEAGDYVKWFVEHAFVFVPAQAIVAEHLASFQQFPPRQAPGSFTVNQVMENLRRLSRNPPASN
jgi:arylsulfatase